MITRKKFKKLKAYTYEQVAEAYDLFKALIYRVNELEGSAAANGDEMFTTLFRRVEALEMELAKLAELISPAPPPPQAVPDLPIADPVNPAPTFGDFVKITDTVQPPPYWSEQ